MNTTMSGEIFHPPDSLEDLDITRWNPLMCYLCNEKYEEPCILGCFHSFCSRCLRGRNVDSKMTCPLCGSNTQIKDGDDLPLYDRLMKFLVESSGDEKEKCANCDNEFEQMFFCNTCDQPLCETCREETHRAKMFARHDIVVLSKRTKEIHRECAIHQEPYILFSTERKSMLCINCFRDMKVESRSYCVDLETAYNQGCKKLDQSMTAIKDLQNSVRDAILLLKVLLEEIEQNADTEKSAVTELYDQLLEKITDTKTSLIQEVDRQYDSKEKTFKAELVALSTLLPTLHTHLVTSAAFCSSANRFEFLDLAYVLMERLKSIIQLQHPLHPSQGSQIITDFKSMFAKCLEPLLFPPKITSVITNSSAISLTGSSSYATARLDPFTTLNASPQVMQRRHTGFNSIKYKLVENKGIFAEHCVEFDTSHRELISNTERMKTLTQELQRDLTVRRCLAKVTVVTELDIKIKSLQQCLEEHFCKNEQKRIILEKHWEESVQRIKTEQELYQAQLHDILRLKQESEQLQTILSRMSSFVSSIASVTERIAPKLGQTKKNSDHDTKIAAIFEQINTMNPDSQHRVDAIRTAQEERETLTANRHNPLDEELIKTKGMLKAPSARKEVGRRDSTKRNSKEIKDFMVETSMKDNTKNQQNKEDKNEIVDIKEIQDEKSNSSENLGQENLEYPKSQLNGPDACNIVNMGKSENSLEPVNLDLSINSKTEEKDLDNRISKDVLSNSKENLSDNSLFDTKTLHGTSAESRNAKNCKVLNEPHNKTYLEQEVILCDNLTADGDTLTADGELFTVPKDIVSSTVKGFENQTSPEKGDNRTSIKRTRRTRRKQSNDNSLPCDSNDNTHKSMIQEVRTENNNIDHLLSKKEQTNSMQESVIGSSISKQIGSSVSRQQSSNELHVEATVELMNENVETTCQVRNGVRQLSESIK